MAKHIIILCLLVLKIVYASALTFVQVIPMEYWCGYVGTDGNLYSMYNGSFTQMPLPGSRTVKYAAGCFNLFRVIANDGTLWQSNQYNVGMTWTQISTDSSNAAINGAAFADGYADNYIILNAADSSLSFGGVDDPDVFHSSGTVFMRPYRFTGSVKFRNGFICARGIYAVTSDSSSLYFWGPGAGTTPTSIYTFSGNGTGKILWADGSNGNAFTSATFVVIQQTAGSSYGHPLALGQGYGFWGSATAQNFTSFTDLNTQWSLGSLVKQICVNFQTTTVLDSLGEIFSTGWNVQGEVGIDTEYVNRYTYVNWPNYGWDGNPNENVVSRMAKISGATKFANIISNKFFTYYHVARDINDSCWYWGRDKTQVIPRPYLLNPTDNAAQPNALDVLQPTMFSPTSVTSSITLNWTGPTLSAGSTQNITTSTTTLTATGHPALLINASVSTDTVLYQPSTVQWAKVSGPSTPIIGSPAAMSTSISGLVNGSYVFSVTTVDNNQGTNRATVTVNVSGVVPYIGPIPAGSKLVTH